MSKDYFEMNDKERQLHHIAYNVDYAISMISEGLSGTGEYDISTDKVRELQTRITDNLSNAYSDISKLLDAVEEHEDKQTLVFNPVGGANEIKAFKDSEVYLVKDLTKDINNINGTEIVFHNTQSGKYKNLIISDDGELSMSQWY
mgnify:CR=1 FL=1